MKSSNLLEYAHFFLFFFYFIWWEPQVKLQETEITKLIIKPKLEKKILQAILTVTWMQPS